MVVGLVGSGTKNNCPGEAQQQLTQSDPTDPETLTLKMVITVFAETLRYRQQSTWSVLESRSHALNPSSGNLRARNYEVAGNVWPAVCSFVWDGILKIDCHGKLFLGFNCRGVGRG
jgi:hypothetical protein